jgi:hypothetical protein
MKTLTLFYFFIFSTSSLHAQALLTERFLGAWTGTGTLYSEAASFSMTWKTVLGGQFTQLQFANRLNSGEFQMHAHGYYKSDEDGEINGFWLDSRGWFSPYWKPAARSSDDILGHTRFGTRAHRV